MNRKLRFRPALWAILGAILLATPLSGAEPQSRKPNIVFILLDNVGREWFGCYGSEEGCTPNIDRLARGGVRFQNCYTTVVCGPSRVELLTGRYPHRTGWYLHHDAALYSGGGFDPKREVAIARVLRDHGYATGLAGKWQVNNLYDEPEALTQHGFQEQLVWPGSIDRDRVDEAFWKSYREAIARRDAPFLTEATRHIESRYWDPVLIRNGQRERVKERFGPEVLAEFARDFVRRHREEPFFFYYPMVLTHGQNAPEPVVVTPANRAPPKDEKGKFADMLRYADQQIGEFVEELDKLGLRDNTLVFIASDNGTEKSLSARANGRVVQGGLYQINEAGGNVPLIVNCPARIPGGRTGALTDFTDIFSTLCSFAGAPRPKGVKFDGWNLAPFLENKPQASLRSWIFNEYGPDRVVRNERYKLNQKNELFDLANDPDEQRPLTALDDSATVAKATLQRILDFMPPAVPLPFEHRSLSAFKLRANPPAKSENEWRPLPLIVDGKVADPWKQIGWGGFSVDDGTLRTEPDDRGMGLLLYTAEKFGDCQLRVVYRRETQRSNSGVYVRLDDGVLSRVGEKSPEVHRGANGKLAPEMIERLKDASEKQLGAWYPVHHGYEVQIMDMNDGDHSTGAIYSLSHAAPLGQPIPDSKPETEWKVMIINLDGERISVSQDRQKLSTFDSSAANLPPRKNWTEPVREIKRPTHGYVGLQNHDPGDVVWFKEISVRPVANAAADIMPMAAGTTYKSLPEIDMQVHAHWTHSSRPRPAVVWIHGGGLINGHREQISDRVRDFALANGFAFISIDYRLAPETKLPAILTDVEDAIKWLRADGAKMFQVDPNRIAVAGGSAGGFLTLASGFRVDPPPQVLLSLWGYGELLSDWASAPSPHPRHHQRKISDEEATRQISRYAVSDSRNRKGDGAAIYLRGRQTGSWAQDVTGFDPRREPEKFTPLLPLKNVTAKYPPTVMVHGTVDTDVPFEQSQLMAREFEKHGVKHALLAVEGGEHGLTGGKPEDIAEAYRKAFEFLKRELLKP